MVISRGKCHFIAIFRGGGGRWSGGNGTIQHRYKLYNTTPVQVIQYIIKIFALPGLCHDFLRSRLNMVKDFHAARTSLGLVNSLQAR